MLKLPPKLGPLLQFLYTMSFCFLSLWLSWVLAAACGLAPVVASAALLTAVAAPVAERRFQEHRLQ